jgi:hypothetical protein
LSFPLLAQLAHQRYGIAGKRGVLAMKTSQPLRPRRPTRRCRSGGLAHQAGYGLAPAGDHHLIAAFHCIQQSRQQGFRFRQAD